MIIRRLKFIDDKVVVVFSLDFFGRFDGPQATWSDHRLPRIAYNPELTNFAELSLMIGRDCEASPLKFNSSRATQMLELVNIIIGAINKAQRVTTQMLLKLLWADEKRTHLDCCFQ